MTTDKAFCKSADGSFGRNTSCRESQSIPIERIYFSQTKSATPFMMEAEDAQRYDVVNQTASIIWGAGSSGWWPKIKYLVLITAQ